MGNIVFPIACPNNQLPSKVPIEMLNSYDGIIISGLEHLHRSLRDTYKPSEWAQVKAPKLAWYHESFNREDYSLNFEDFQPWADFHGFPAAQDASNGYWLPFAVDTEVFKPMAVEKQYDALFIGTPYGKRERFLNELQQIDLATRKRLSLMRVDAGDTVRENMALYAETINRAKIFVNLPSMSNLFVTKVVEVMACKVPLITHSLHMDGKKNYDLLERQILALFYDNAAELAEALWHWWEYPETAQEVADDAYQLILKKHTLEKRCAEILKILSL
jgi:hypothetical protein